MIPTLNSRGSAWHFTSSTLRVGVAFILSCIIVCTKTFQYHPTVNKPTRIAANNFTIKFTSPTEFTTTSIWTLIFGPRGCIVSNYNVSTHEVGKTFTRGEMLSSYHSVPCNGNLTMQLAPSSSYYNKDGDTEFPCLDLDRPLMRTKTCPDFLAEVSFKVPGARPCSDLRKDELCPPGPPKQRPTLELEPPTETPKRKKITTTTPPTPKSTDKKTVSPPVLLDKDTNDPTRPGSDGVNKGVVIGISVAAVFIIIVVALLVFFCRRRRSRRNPQGSRLPTVLEDVLDEGGGNAETDMFMEEYSGSTTESTTAAVNVTA